MPEGRGRGEGSLQGDHPAHLVEDWQAVEGREGRAAVGLLAGRGGADGAAGADLQQGGGELGPEGEHVAAAGAVGALGRRVGRVGRRREEQVGLREEAREAGGGGLAQRARRGGRLALGAAVQAEGAAAERHRLGPRHAGGGGRSGRGCVAHARLLRVVDEVAARPVGAEAARVERAAQVGLVLGVARQVAQLVGAVRELALVAVLADAALLVGAAQLGLVAARVDVGRRRAHQTLVHRLAVAPVQLAVAVHGLDGDGRTSGGQRGAHALRRRRVASAERLVSVALQLLLLDRTADGAAVQLEVHLQQVVRHDVAAVLWTKRSRTSKK